ncbi:hypothetical protein ACHAQH_002252 [Verticillium albo-atrum]
MNISSPLQRISLFAPITALAFLPFTTPTLLVAEDNLLKVYDTSTHTLCLTLRIFHAQTIHGITISNNLILLWGNQSITALPASALGGTLSGKPLPPLTEVKAHDWLFSAAVSPQGRIAFVTAHNEILEATYDAAAQKLVLGRIVAPARPGLYAAKAAWTSASTLLIAGGTAFGEIVVWTCDLPVEGTPSCEVLSVFAGHEGSIFGVDISPEFDVLEGKMRLLASCSDDRTIRVWDVSEGSLKRGLVQASFGEARETGFGSVDLSAVADASSAPVAVAMGHGSRIWHVKFAGHAVDIEDGQVSMPVYSFGEDATAQKWRLEVDVEAWQNRRASDGTDRGVGKLSHRETFAHHDGKHIWAAVVEPLKQGGSLIATGGADARVNLITDNADSTVSRDDKTGFDALPSELSQLVYEDILSRLPPSTQEYPPPSRKRPEGFQNFVFISQNTLLTASTRGRLLLGTFGSKLTWEEISYGGVDARDVAFCTAIKSPAPGMAFLGTTTKKLLLYKDTTIREISVMAGKVSDIFFITPNEENPSTVELLVMMIGGSETMQLLTIDVSSATITSTLSVPGQEASYVATAAHLTNDVLLIGSRHGHISLFERSSTELTLLEPIVRHTSDTITSIISLSTSLPGQTHILTTARDAHYRLYSLLPFPTPHLSLLHQTSVPLLTTIESAHFSPQNDLLLTGFRGKLFTLYNEYTRCDLHSHDVGGPNRIWSAPSPTSSPLRIAYAKAGALLLRTQHNPPHKVLKPGTHGREIRAIACSDGPYPATASEDTSIRLWQDGRCVASLKDHRAGLQGLRWLADRGDGALLFSCGGNEEFVAWRVRRVPAAGAAFSGPAVLREAVWGDKSPDGDLRILDFDVTAGEGGVVVASMVFSNSTVGTYLYEGGEFTVLARGRYTGACLTRVKHLRVDGDKMEILAAATDGHLGVWTAQKGENGTPGEYSLQTTARLHQSSVKALDTIRLEQQGAEIHLILTGGDDNGLGMTLLQRQEGEYTFISKTGVKGAHAAAINGLAILKTTSLDVEKQTRRTVFATVSNDQRVKVWSLRWGLAADYEVQLTLLANENSGVADPGDLDVLDGDEEKDYRQVMVVGVGMETWRFDLQEKGALRRE